MRKNLIWLACVVGLAFAIVAGLAYVSQVSDRVERLESDRSALSQQVRDLGGTPVVGPRGENGLDGADGQTGPSGPPGPTGAAGVDGQDGTDGVPGSPGPTGPAGPSGQPGMDGTHGRDGIDGEPGPTGPVGPQGDQGPPASACPTGYIGTDMQWQGDTLFVCRKETT